MSLYGMLNLGSRSLAAHSAAMDLIGNNIANAATPGYHRQTAKLRPDQVVGGSGQGVVFGGLRRAFDVFTEGQIIGQRSATSREQHRSQVLSVVDGLFDESTTAGLSGAVDAFYAALSDLSTHPESGSVRTTVLGTAQTLSRRFNDLSRGLSDLRSQQDDQVSSDVTKVNDLLRKIAALNVDIAEVTGRGQTPGNLMDQRDAAVEELAGLINVVVKPEDNGQVGLTLDGYSLVQDGFYHALKTFKDPDNGGHLGVSITGAGATTYDVTQVLAGGSLGAAIELRDVSLVAYTQELDTLAFEMGNRINTVHEAGYGTDGVTGRQLFNVSATSAGAAGSLKVSTDVAGKPTAIAAATDPANVPGDGTNALALYATGEETLAGLGGLTFRSFYSDLVSQVGSDTSDAADQYAFEESQMYELNTLRASQSGVNLDEEATELTKFQSAYQASARFVSAVNEMLDVLMRM